MLIIYKYAVAANCDNTLWLPKGAKVLSVQVQQNTLQCWVLQSTVNPEWENIIVSVWGTGIGIPDSGKLKYLNTCMSDNGAFVWHAFIRDIFWKM